jgi:hypothetical protein
MSAATVFVAAKLPNGIVIEGVRVLGTAADRLPGQLVSPGLVGGFKITPGIPAEKWERWAAANAAAPMVTNHLVLADADLETLKRRAREHASTRSGMEATRRS